MSQPSQPATAQDAILTSLFIEAVRQGHSTWFRVVSKSMLPLIGLGDEIYVEPARAHDIRTGEIAAFETSQGLVIHRIVQSQQTAATTRLLQMSDVELLPTWVREQAVVGRVVSICRPTRRQAILRQTHLLHPIAKWCGMVTARVRYKLYLCGKKSPLQLVLRGCSRLCIHVGYWCIRSCCTSLVVHK